MRSTLAVESRSPATPLLDVPTEHGSAHEAIGRSIQMMSEQHHETLSLQQLADCACYSKFHYSRTFRRMTGLSPGRYLTLLRMNRALGLLRSTDLKVIDVATTVGYSSVGTFSTRFRQRFGVSPTQYRARHHSFVAGLAPG